jgi:hypothetical protein
MIQTILIGPPSGSVGGGIAQFLQFALHYRPLAFRLGAAAIVGLSFRWSGWSLGANMGLFAFEIYLSLVVIRFLAGVSQWWQIGRILTAMWLPISVIAVAAYLLFFNDQGRELGVGLMDLGFLRGFSLACVLVYWACNNWLSARVGLARTFPNPANEDVLLFWGPRLIGVLAHLLAAFSLSTAAWSEPLLHEKIAWPLDVLAALVAPVAILVATAFSWLLDYTHLSKRSGANQQRLARRWIYPVATVEFLLLGGLLAAWRFEKVPPGFFLATLLITFSAVFFLALISWLRSRRPLAEGTTDQQRDADHQYEQNVTRRWTLSLASLTLLGTLAIWVWPMTLGQFFGSLTVACYSFGAFLALVNLLHLTARWLAQYAGGVGFAITPHAVMAVFLWFLVLPAFIVSLTQSIHRVRLCEDRQCTPAPAAKGWTAVETPDRRPTVSDAALAWYAQAEPVYHSLHPGQSVPMLIVATAGGGIRAAYWTATVLEKLEHLGTKALDQSAGDEIRSEGLTRHLLFAISGVSGGAVGAAAYAAAVHDHDVNGTAIKPTDYLKEDFLAPGLASMIFIDGPSNFVPDFGQIDRGQALERGFEYASRTTGDKGGLVSHTFLSFFPAIDGAAKPESWRPILLFNATHQETGRRIITSHVKIERDVFVDSYDALEVLGRDIRLSTAAHNSARFTYISPAGNLISAKSANRGYVIDGGYFENYGAETALELAREAIHAIDPNRENKVKLVVLQISSDPTLMKYRTLVRSQPRSDGVCTLTTFEPGKGSDESDATVKQPLPKDNANYLEVLDPVPPFGKYASPFGDKRAGPFGDKREGEGFVLSYANELSAPLVGIMSVRQAHGTTADAELAASICQGNGKVATALRNAIERKTTAGAAGEQTAGSKNDQPHFAHMAMCATSWNDGRPGINPPLGWVLSQITRNKFKDILGDCDNGKELRDLEAVLGLALPGLASSQPDDGQSDAKATSP